jgi:hypothetical protein
MIHFDFVSFGDLSTLPFGILFCLSPPLSSPARRGGGRRKGIERVERLERLERQRG